MLKGRKNAQQSDIIGKDPDVTTLMGELFIQGLFVFSHPMIFIAMFKFIFNFDWKFPYYSIVFINFIPFLGGIAYFVKKVIAYSDINENIFYMNGIQMFFVAIPHSGYTLTAVASLY